MTFTNEQLISLATNPQAATATQMLAAELMELKARPRDEYHTMDELYEQRMLWNALAVGYQARINPGSVTKSWLHADGEPCFGKTAPGERWFIVTASLPNGPEGKDLQVSQHYPERDWDLFHCIETERAPEWDGHTPQQGNARLRWALLH